MKRFVVVGMVGILVGLGGPVVAAENETSEMYAMGNCWTSRCYRSCRTSS